MTITLAGWGRQRNTDGGEGKKRWEIKMNNFKEEQRNKPPVAVTKRQQTRWRTKKQTKMSFLQAASKPRGSGCRKNTKAIIPTAFFVFLPVSFLQTALLLNGSKIYIDLGKTRVNECVFPKDCPNRRDLSHRGKKYVASINVSSVTFVKLVNVTIPGGGRDDF